METVGIREFRDKLATYVESEGPVAITRHGETVGLYLPVRRKRSEQERAQLREAVAGVEKALVEAGISEDEIVEDFERWRKSNHG